MKRILFASLACLLAAAVGGCGSGDGLSRTKLHGKLMANGKPLNGALVRFVPINGTKGSGGSARTNFDGSFDLADDRGFKGGVVPGEYRVTVSHYLLPDGSPMPVDKSEVEYPEAREQMPRKITSADNSPLTYTVVDGGGDADITIPSEFFIDKGKKFVPEAPRPGGV